MNKLSGAKTGLSISALDLSTRAQNCLWRSGIDTIGDLMQMTEQDLIDIRNLGPGTLGEVKAGLGMLGLSLKCPVNHGRGDVCAPGLGWPTTGAVLYGPLSRASAG